jgi:large subunit ribosomal protein L5
MTSFKKMYKDEIVKKLMELFGYQSVMQVPKIEKITINMGVGEAAADKKVMLKALSDLTKISGQKPIVCKARKSVASFKIREGWPIGCKVTLRGEKMYDFFQRLVMIVLPRVRDFRGLSVKSFDKFGNYNFGVKEQSVYPEIDFDQIDAVRGMDINITTSATDAKEACALISAFGFPFNDKDKLL